MTRQTTTPLPQLIYPRILHLRRRIQALIYTPISGATIDVQIGPIHPKFISWNEAVHEFDTSKCYERLRVGERFSPASSPLVDASTTPSSSALNDNDDDGGDDAVREFPWTQRWFRVELTLPATPCVSAGASSHEEDEVSAQHVETSQDGGGQKCDQYLYFVAHGEFTVYTNSGDVWCGIDPVHDRVPISPLLQQRIDDQTTSSCTVWLDGGQWQTGFWFGLHPPTVELGFRLLKLQCQQKNHTANEVYHDISMLIEWIEYIYEKEGIPLNTENGYYSPLGMVPPILRRVLHLFNLACDIYDRTKSLLKLRLAIRSIYERITTPPPTTSFPGGEGMKICHVGHAHMDLVWMWPERVTYQKIIHTYSNVLQLMNTYPDFTFTMSQPPLYYHIQKTQPKLAHQIQQKISSGQWEFTGALEVECDTQLPVGEGLVRCILYGQERIRNVRGCSSETVWLPDVFGYSQCLPQIFHLAEIPNFFTTKILWSTITKFPHNSFNWIGPDGESSVLAHLGVSGYNSKITMKEAMTAVRQYKNADVHGEVLCPSGYGDGGGGPSEEQIERSLRLQRSFIGGETTPSCRWGTVDSFFQRLALEREELPIYRGELFLEYHRAVHTTQSDFKYHMRACERALQQREALRVISGNFTPLDMKNNWERYLFALFHDAAPGSSINSVYRDLNAELKSLAKHQVEAAIDEWPHYSSQDSSDTTFTVVNPLAWTRFSMVHLPADLFDDGHSSYIVRSIDAEVSNQVQFVNGKPCAMVKVTGLSALPFTLLPTGAEEETKNMHMKATPNLLSNGIVSAEFDEYGQLCSILIRGEPLLLTRGKAASFTLHDDNPEAYDAWDMDHHVVWLKDNAITEPVTLKVIECGPIVSTLRSDSIPIGSNGSTMEIEYQLYSKEDSLRVIVFVEWRESHKTLRYEVPTDYCGDYARFGSPFNFVDRSQIPQTHKEEGEWEVPASRWASILNGSMDGLSIVTQSKYGFRAKLGILSFTLLRSSTFPDPKADQGKHRIQFAITKHQNTFQYANKDDDLITPTAAKADELFTQPLVLSKANTIFSSNARPLIRFTELGSAVPSWVMPSMCKIGQGQGFCVRLHEVSGANTNISFSIASLEDYQNIVVESVNFNEKRLAMLDSQSVDAETMESAYTLPIAAYKIMTLRILYS